MVRTDALQARTNQRKQAIIKRRQMIKESRKEENFKRLSHSVPISNLEEHGSHC